MNDLKLWQDDPYLEPYKKVIFDRHQSSHLRILEIAGYNGKVSDYANAHLYYGVHKNHKNWYFREWAPNASAIFLIGEMNGWKKLQEFKFKDVGNGNWELVLPLNSVKHGELYKWLVEWPGGEGERLPAYTRRCVQDQVTKIFSSQIWDKEPYNWQFKRVGKIYNPLIYEAHIGMSSEKEEIATFNYFRENVLPRVSRLGYNTIQLMALQEHPYYGSFGYQVSNFFAVSSRFGTPEELKMLVDEAHSRGIAVIMDIVHSHSVNNVAEGLSMFDGTDSLYFHSGDRGKHPAWTSRCFDYGKYQVQSFLLSNCKYWMEEFNLDGFRFDGITSMIYLDHGLGVAFTDYSQYYNGNQDQDALTYLTLANKLIKEINPDSITIAEDVSGLPGLAAPFENGGVGFDYRMSMGVSDHWIKWIKELNDEEWNMGEVFFELTNKRADEKTISYAECHDQAMVGDKTIIFRLLDKEMYFSMSKIFQNLLIDRGIALHKLIRLVTIATAGDGYLNFMGNEFGHPEWIDFPREGNGWSLFYARRQWSLAENSDLRYSDLENFDIAMINLFRSYNILSKSIQSIYNDNEKQVMIFSRGEYIFVFNFNSNQSFTNYRFKVPAGTYSIVLDSDQKSFGGFSRNDENTLHKTIKDAENQLLSLYIPSRSSIVLKMTTK